MLSRGKRQPKGRPMFLSSRTFTAERHRKLRALNGELYRTQGHWFDGSPESIDARLSKVRHALNEANALVADGELHAVKMATELAEQEQNLLQGRQTLMESPFTTRKANRERMTTRTSSYSRRYVAENLELFLADNAEVLDDPEELDTRAKNQVEIETFSLPMPEVTTTMSHFRRAVAEAARRNRV